MIDEAMSACVEKATPLVSVIMPAYNCASYIEIAVRSVMNQTYTNWELLVLDDGSTDDTCAIVRDLAREDARIRLLPNEKNVGVARTRNRGLELSTGDYVAFLDSDDVWHPNKLAVQLQMMQEQEAAIACCSYAIVDSEGQPCRPPYLTPENICFKDMLRENHMGCSTVMLTAAVAKAYRFATDFYHEDYCLWLDILRDGHKAVGCTEVLADWRLIMNSRSANKKNCAVNRWKIYRHHLKLSLIKSSVLFSHYMISGIKKYYVVSRQKVNHCG